MNFMEPMAPRSPGPVRQIPITLLTGFLGSGKTTLLRQILRSPTWTDTAVLVNEIGAIGLDHTLMWGAGAAVQLMENGCICCSVSDDLITSLEELFWKRLHRKIPYFSRVVIETTGLADPRPIMQALRSHPLVTERYRLDFVVCTVDAEYGLTQLETHPESVAQVASADVILLTKTDIASELSSKLLQANLARLNPAAIIQQISRGQIPSEFLKNFILSTNILDRINPRLLVAKNLDRSDDQGAMRELFQARTGRRVFHQRITTSVMHFDQPWRPDEFEKALQATVARYGDQILRMKGLINVVDGSAPLVIQVVQRRIFPFEILRSPTELKVRSFMVFIAVGPIMEGAIENEFFSRMDGAQVPVLAQ